MKQVVLMVLMGSMFALVAGCGDDTSPDVNTDGDAAGDSEGCNGCLIDDWCFDDGAVNPANPCEICVPQSAAEAWSANEGAACESKDPCTTNGVCDAEGLCRGEMKDCSHQDGQCTVGTCMFGQCVGEIQIGFSCDDGDPETVNDTCNSVGECVGVPETCTGCLIAGQCYESESINPENPCEICVPQSAAEAWSANEGATCDDSEPCTLDDVCDAEGRCRGEMMDCSHYDAQCAVGTCMFGHCVGEIQLDGPCDDGDPETINDSCGHMETCIGESPLCEADNGFPEEIDFGQVEINQSARQNLTIHNPMSFDLHIRQLTLDGNDRGGFAIDPAVLDLIPKTLTPGEDWDIPLIFTARDTGSEGTETATFRLRSNEPLSNSCEVSLVAELVSPAGKSQ